MSHVDVKYAENIADPARPHTSRRERAVHILGRFGAVWFLIALCIAFSIALPNTFPKWATLQTLLSTQAVVGVVALGVLFPLAAGEFDLSIAAIGGITALIVAELNGTDHWAAGTTLLAGVVIGPVLGLANGLLITKLKINSFIATLATATILGGIAIAISTIVVSANPASKFSTWGQTMLFGQIPIEALYWLIAAIVAWFLIDVTAWGRYLRVVGANPRSAVLVGLPVSWLKVSGFVMAGLFGGIAGVISTVQIGSASAATGAEWLLPAYAAAYVGATTIFPGRFNVPGTIVAVFLLAVGITGIQLLGSPTWVTQVFDGAALLIAVALPARRQLAQPA